MIELYYWPTPNGHKMTMFLEEAGLPYEIKPIDITKGEQFDPAFLSISPNNKMPAIIDRAPDDGGEPISIFESGAILLYLAGKTGKFLSEDVRQRNVTLEWLFWQMASVGPMLGQNHHFNSYAPEKIPYAIERYVNETHRLYGVLEKRLDGREFIAGTEYSIADIAAYPWLKGYEGHQIDIEEFPRVEHWLDVIAERDATRRAYAVGENYKGDTGSDEARKHLFGQR